MKEGKERGIADLLDGWSWRWSETQANKNVVSSLGLSRRWWNWQAASRSGIPIWERRRLVSVVLFNRLSSSLSDTLYTNRPRGFTWGRVAGLWNTESSRNRNRDSGTNIWANAWQRVRTNTLNYLWLCQRSWWNVGFYSTQQLSKYLTFV